MHKQSTFGVMLTPLVQLLAVIVVITGPKGANGTGGLFQLPSGHRPGPFYDRQAANVVPKPWTDMWGCANSPDYIRDVPQPFLRQSQNGRSRANSRQQMRNESRRNSRMLYGDSAGRDDFPYVVSIINLAVPSEGAKAPTLGSRSETGRRVCAGAIINRRHIVTAASCVSGATPSTLDVRTGVIDLTDPLDGRRVTVQAIKTHPEYQRAWNMYWNDIALIRLQDDLDLSGLSVKAVCPPVTQQTRYLHRRIGQRGMVSSWGTTKYGGPTESKLRYGEFQAVPTFACQMLGITLLRPIPANQVLCAHGDGGVVRALCTGDSGAPYIVLDHDTGLPMLVGIATVPPNEDCLEYQVTLFTRLDNYLGWLKDSMTTDRW